MVLIKIKNIIFFLMTQTSIFIIEKVV